MNPNECPLCVSTLVWTENPEVIIKIILITYIDVVYYRKLQVPCFEEDVNEF